MLDTKTQRNVTQSNAKKELYKNSKSNSLLEKESKRAGQKIKQ